MISWIDSCADLKKNLPFQGISLIGQYPEFWMTVSSVLSYLQLTCQEGVAAIN